MKTRLPRVAGWCALMLLGGMMLSGCATGPDWNQRVGSYTLDQAILDLGPPDKTAKLTDGTTVSEWLVRRGQSGGRIFFGGYGGWYGPYGYYGPTVMYDDASTYESFLRLTFAPDGTLRAWKRHIR